MIDHRIIQQIGVRDNAPALNMFQNVLNQAQNRRIQTAQAERQAALAPFQQQIVEQQAAEGKRQVQQARRGQILQSMNDFAVGNASVIQRAQQTGDSSQLRSAFVQHRQRLIDQDVPTETTDEAIGLIDEGKAGEVISGLGDAVNLFNQQQGRGKSVGQRDFESKVAIVKADPELKTAEGKAAAIALGLEAKASTSAAERIASDPKLAQLIADVEGLKATATETGKLKTQLKFKPQITKAVKLAEKAATERGEVLTDLARMEASLPGVKEVVNELIDLSSIATSTLGGRAFDFAVKESGFGSTKGADARAKLIAIVDNQVLPLLRETFGAAFTKAEGDTLKASLVDPDASPSQKREQLTAFIAQKERNVRAKQTQLDIQPDAGAGVESAIDISSMSIEELIAERERLGGK